MFLFRGRVILAIVITVLSVVEGQWLFPPRPAKTQLQTNGPLCDVSIGDGWSNNGNLSGNKPHVYEIYLPATVDPLFTVQLDIFDPECFGLGADRDERHGASWDRTNFVLFAPQADVIVAQRQFDPTFSTSQRWISFASFNRQSFGSGIYRLEVTTLTDDENTYQLRIRQNDPDGVPLSGDEIHIAAVRTSVESVVSGATRFHFYAREDQELLLANFDMDQDSTCRYQSPDGQDLSGTASANGLWNGGVATLPPPGGDLIARPASGWWQAMIPASSGNQYTFYCARPFLIDTTVAHPQLSVQIDDGCDVARSDTVLTYSVQVSNIGAGPALQVSVMDTLPQGLDVISCSEPVRVLAAGSRTLLCWELAAMRPGETVSLEIRARTNERAVDEILHAILVSWSDVLFTEYRPIRCSDRDSLSGVMQRVEMTNRVNPVELSHFSGLAKPGAIRLTWLTESETDNLGFNVWRSEESDGGYRQINDSMIPGAGNSQDPHTYEFEDGEVKPAVTYYYKLEDVDYSGNRQSHGPYRVVASGQPAGFGLEQNYPNPFNGETVIEYGIEQPGYVSLAIYNLLGQSVKLLAQGNMEAGSHSARWNGRDEMGRPLQSGTYFYVLQTGEQKQVRKMQLIQ